MKVKRNMWRTTTLSLLVMAFAIGCEQSEPTPLELISPELCNKDALQKPCSGTVTCGTNDSGYCECVCSGSDNDDN